VNDLDALVDPLLRRLARYVADELRAGTEPNHVDQHASPLGPRRHVAAIRSGKLRGVQVGRRWLAKREDVDSFVAKLTAKKPRERTAEEELAAELGIAIEATH
jgi:excisionase family DNA binding protein